MKSSKGRILCVDDDADTCELLTTILTHEGYQVESTHSPLEVIPLLKQHSFDLVLVDNWMPHMNGDELTRAIREFDETTPILFYSAAGYQSDKQAAVAAGAQGYLVKPLGITELTDEVARLIRSPKSG